tara:strand:- start:1537 stop:2508 length:972 start_codon:yes stop_codon:yes gene_type:complete
MHKPVAIIAGEPNSISSEIIFKSWKLRKKNFKFPLIIIGNIKLFNLQKKKLKYHFKIKKIEKNFNIKDLTSNKLPVYNVNYKQKKPFQKITSNSNKYIFECFDVALELIKNKKILGIVNCPVSKETLFKKKYQGVTELLSKKTKSKNNEVMLIFNKKLSVAPLTTHISISQVKSKLKKQKIINKIKVIDSFYKKNLNKRPKIAVLGLNPHNFSTSKKSEEKKIIIPAIKSFKKSKIKVIGPISPDSSFINSERKKFDVILGMYHDQVLTPFKALFKYDAINITLGLPFIRTSPDHGTAVDITGKNIANPKSLIESIKFFNLIT